MSELEKQVVTTTLDADPNLLDPVESLGSKAWPSILYHSDVESWRLLFTTFTRFQIVLTDRSGDVVAAGHTVPVVWDGTTEDLPKSIEDILQRAINGHRNAVAPTTLVALAAIVDPKHQRKGLSSVLVRAMVDLARENRLDSVIAPVRPTLKSQYPLIPIDRYAELKQVDDLPFDPWMRVHAKLGAVQLAIAPKTLVVTGTVREWEKWTGRRFPKSGSYLVKGALAPVIIDKDKNKGTYEEPNIWMLHSVMGAVSRP